MGGGLGSRRWQRRFVFATRCAHLLPDLSRYMPSNGWTPLSWLSWAKGSSSDLPLTASDDVLCWRKR
jgi:hypothetical protein